MKYSYHKTPWYCNPECDFCQLKFPKSFVGKIIDIDFYLIMGNNDFNVLCTNCINHFEEHSPDFAMGFYAKSPDFVDTD